MTSEEDFEELRKRFADFSDTARRILPSVRSEAEICKSLIDPLLRNIDWSPDNTDRVKREYTIPLTNGKADYALLGTPADSPTGTLGSPLIIIEAKHKKALVEHHLPPDQLSKYLLMLPTCFIGAWTNGSTWCWFCRDHANALSAKPFLQFDVTQEGWLIQPVQQWLASLRQQYHNPDPAELMRISRRQDLLTQLRTWWDSTRHGLSDGTLKTLWGELNGLRGKPDKLGFEDLKRAWNILHEDAPKPTENKPLHSGPEGLAWCFRDRVTGRWSAWKTRTYAVDVQADVTEWLIQWNHDGCASLLEDATEKTLIHFSKANPKKYWARTLCNGSVHMYTSLTNNDRVEWLGQLAKRTRDRSGNAPVRGVDFELYSPPR